MCTYTHIYIHIHLWIDEIKQVAEQTLVNSRVLFLAMTSSEVKYHCVKVPQFLFLLGSIYPHVLRDLVVWGCLQIEIPHECLCFSDGLNIFGIFIVIIRFALVTIRKIDNLEINVTGNSKCALAVSSQNSKKTTVERHKKQWQTIREAENSMENY